MPEKDIYAPKLPFKLPPSLASYAEQYQKKPEKTIKRFKKQLRRRGPDAVGYFMLGWFYYQQNEKEKAIDCALRAKTLAPGSPFFEKLHYFFSHPGLFAAWRSPGFESAGVNHIPPSGSSDLNSLIEKLSGVDTKRIQIDSEFKSAGNNRPYDTKEVDDIVSETLAKVHEQQGNNNDAIRTYRALKRVNSEKADFYDKKIEKLKQLQSNEDED